MAGCPWRTTGAGRAARYGLFCSRGQRDGRGCEVSYYEQEVLFRASFGFTDLDAAKYDQGHHPAGLSWAGDRGGGHAEAAS